MTDTRELTMWKVHAGGGGRYIAQFLAQKCIAIGWERMGDLSALDTREKIRGHYGAMYPDDSSSKAGQAIGVIYNFRNNIQREDIVIVPNFRERECLVGDTIGEYRYKDGEDQPHQRTVKWCPKRIDVDKLSALALKPFGSLLTIIQIKDEAKAEILAQLSLADAAPYSPPPKEGDSINELVNRGAARNQIQRLIRLLKPEQMEDLAVAILRAMGYRTMKTPKTGDGGMDIIASPDGIAVKKPIIRAEVKHRKDKCSIDEIQRFAQVTKGDWCGLYFSTGGFAQPARTEANSVGITLLDIEEITSLIEVHYDNFDEEGRELLPLVKIYWPK